MQLNYKDIKAKFDKFYQLTLRDWMVYHQRDILPQSSAWKGISVIKPPHDLWVYQELIFDLKPEVVVEIGSYYGGTTQFLADIFPDITVVSVDIDRKCYMAKAPNIIDITGDCHHPETVDKVRVLCEGKKTLIIHDADHRKEAVLKDFELYSPMVSVDSYFIIEDAITDLFTEEEKIGTPWDGPLHAIIEIMKNTDEFVLDRRLEYYLITYAPYGFLRRVRGQG